MNWKPKNDTVGVPGKGFIKSSAYSQEDEDNLIMRAINRNVDVNVFMINAGFVMAKTDQLEIPLESGPALTEEKPKTKKSNKK